MESSGRLFECAPMVRRFVRSSIVVGVCTTRSDYIET